MQKYNGPLGTVRRAAIAQRVPRCSHTLTSSSGEFMRRMAVVLLLLLPTSSPRPRAQQAPDWKALDDETLHTLVGLHEGQHHQSAGERASDGARFLKAILDKEGIEAQILDTAELGPQSRESLRAAQGKRHEEGHRARAPHGRRAGRAELLVGRSVRRRR